MKRGFLLPPQENLPPKPSEAEALPLVNLLNNCTLGANEAGSSDFDMDKFVSSVLNFDDKFASLTKQLATLEIRLGELQDITESTKNSDEDEDLLKFYLAHTEAQQCQQQFDKLELELKKEVPVTLAKTRELQKEGKRLLKEGNKKNKQKTKAEKYHH